MLIFVGSDKNGNEADQFKTSIAVLSTLKEKHLDGMLHFSCQVKGWVLGLRFTYATCDIKRTHHSVRISSNMRKDIKVWIPS